MVRVRLKQISKQGLYNFKLGNRHMIDLEWDINLQPISSAAHPNSHYCSANTPSRCN